MGVPPKSILAISDLTLGGSTDRADVPIGNAQQSLCSSGTDGSNPVSSSSESASRGSSPSHGEKPAFRAGVRGQEAGTGLSGRPWPVQVGQHCPRRRDACHLRGPSAHTEHAEILISDRTYRAWRSW